MPPTSKGRRGAVFRSPRGHFNSSIDRHISRLRVRNYPDSDYDSRTTLRTEDRPGGLQVLSKEGDWLDIPHMPGCFIVNIGGMMVRWTNDRWVSTLHRVANPPSERCADAANPPKCPSTTSGGHLRERFPITQQQIAYTG